MPQVISTQHGSQWTGTQAGTQVGLSVVSETTISKTAGKEALIFGFPIIGVFYVAPSSLMTRINQKSYHTPVIQGDVTVVEDNWELPCVGQYPIFPSGSITKLVVGAGGREDPGSCAFSCPWVKPFGPHVSVTVFLQLESSLNLFFKGIT